MKRRGPTGSLERNRRDAAAEKERVEQKDQKIGKYEEDASEQVIGALIEVHRALATSLLESAYEACLCHELQAFGASRCRPLHLSDLSDLFVALPLPSGRGLLRAAPFRSVESRY